MRITTHTTTLTVVLIAIPVVHGSRGCFSIVSVSLRSVVHFDVPTHELSSIHFLQCSFGLFFGFKFYKAISFGNSTNRIDDDFGLKNRLIDLFKSME